MEVSQAENIAESTADVNGTDLLVHCSNILSAIKQEIELSLETKIESDTDINDEKTDQVFSTDIIDDNVALLEGNINVANQFNKDNNVSNVPQERDSASTPIGDSISLIKLYDTSNSNTESKKETFSETASESGKDECAATILTQIMNIDENAQDQSSADVNFTSFSALEFNANSISSLNEDSSSKPSEGGLKYTFINSLDDINAGDSNDESLGRLDEKSVTSSIVMCDDQSEISENSLMNFPEKRIIESFECDNSSDVDSLKVKDSNHIQSYKTDTVSDQLMEKDMCNSVSYSLCTDTSLSTLGLIFPAENLFEYQWPQESGAEWYMIQEQISEYLHIKSFKRKYPDLARRVPSQDEREFLKMRGAISETQCELGLTALRADEVHDLMMRDHPLKYQEYEAVIQDKEKQNLKEKLKSYNAPKMDQAKFAAFVKKAVKSAADFNVQFHRERREERRAYIDLQTMAIHYPANKRRVLPPHCTKPGPYPVSLIPGQYQDYFRDYTSEELKYLPINTALYGPPKKLTEKDLLPSDDEESLSNDSVDETAAVCSSRDAATSTTFIPIPKSKQVSPGDRVCRVCRIHPENGKLSDEELVQCSECCSFGHPSCLELPADMVTIIKTYAWQCMDCKTCVECMDPYDEDRMLFCDQCDRGYHTFCVGLRGLPMGRWECHSCCQETPKRKKPRKDKKDKKKEYVDS